MAFLYSFKPAYYEKLRFKDFFEVSEGISPKVLSSELSLLEAHQLIQKNIEYTPTQDITYYALTKHAQEIWIVLNTLIESGLSNRKEVIRSIHDDKNLFGSKDSGFQLTGKFKNH